MKKSLIVFVLLAIFGLTTSQVLATVGGPTYIYDIRSGAGSDIIYVEQSFSGKGCPPEIYSLNPSTGSKTKLVDCDEMLESNSPYDAKLEATLAKYPKLLNRIDLAANMIRGEIKVTKEIQNDWGGSTEFAVDIFQNNKKISTFNYAGCSPDQPHVIEGYVRPRYNYLVLVVSSIGDCFEGGYTREHVQFARTVTVYDPVALPIRDANTPAFTDAVDLNGNLLLIARNSTSETIQPTTSVPQTPVESDLPEKSAPLDSNSTIYLGTIIFLFVIILVLVFQLKRN